jgi:RNA polymerase sigma factor (sigma-70 family)
VQTRLDDDKTAAGRLEELDRSFRAPLLAYFSRRVRDRSDAQDLTQEVFVRLANHPDRNNGDSIQAYVFTIAANLLRDRARSASTGRGRQHQSLDLLSDSDAISPSLTEDRDPERVLVGKEMLQDVLEALAELGERTRDFFILSRLESMSHRDIAMLHGVSVSAVEKHIMRATVHLGARFLQL